jgi:hypothetical protein
MEENSDVYFDVNFNYLVISEKFEVLKSKYKARQKSEAVSVTVKIIRITYDTAPQGGERPTHTHTLSNI